MKRILFFVVLAIVVSALDASANPAAIAAADKEKEIAAANASMTIWPQLLREAERLALSELSKDKKTKNLKKVEWTAGRNGFRLEFSKGFWSGERWTMWVSLDAMATFSINDGKYGKPIKTWDLLKIKK